MKPLNEKSPPGMEDWIKKNKKRFKKQYGEDYESWLYGTAWDIHNKKTNEASGYDTGAMTTPQSKKAYVRAKEVKDFDDATELEEEQVHPDDKIGQSMLKKMGVPNYFTSDKKKQETHQKKVDEDQLDEDPINEMNTHPEDKIARMMMDRLKSPYYFESSAGQETHQKDVTKIPKKYVEASYAETNTDAPGNKTGNLPAKYGRAILVAK